MCWMCDHPGATMQDHLDEVRSKMLRHGWAVHYVEANRTPYAYTVGLTRRDLPELLVTGVSPQGASRLLTSAVEYALRGAALAPGAQWTLRAGPRVEAVEVEHPDAHMGAAVAFFADELRAVQLVWADGRGRWPWAADFCDGGGRQPVLGVRAGPT